MKKASKKPTKAKKTAAKKAPAKSSTPAIVDNDDFQAFEGGEFDTSARPDHVETEDVTPETTEGGEFPPTLKLMQALSPELDSDEEKYLADAEAGDLVVDDGTNQFLFDGQAGITFIPLLSRKRWNEWVPRKKGGGFVASYASKEEAEMHFTKGHELNVSIEYLCTTKDVDQDGNYTPLLIQFNSPTKMSVARDIANHIKNFKTMYGVAYKITAKRQKNKAGQAFFNFKVTPVGWVNEALYTTMQQLQLENTDPFVNQASYLPDGADEEDSEM